jgi:hypothetical protein
MTSDTWGKLLIVTDAECICWDISSFKKMYSCPVGHLLRSGVQDLKVTEGGCCRLQISSKESYMYDPAVGAWVGTFELDFPDAQVCPLRQDPGEFPVVMEAIPRVGCTTLKQKD